MQRIPIRIYRLKHTSGNTAQASAPRSIPDSQYAVGVTTNDIITGQDSKRYINIPNISGGSPATAGRAVLSPDSYRPAEVTTDDQGRTYYMENSKKVYIRQSGAKPTYDDLPPVFEFYVNPQSIQPNYQKLQTEVRTRGGWEIQHWGEQLTEITVTGKSGGLHRDASVSAKPGEQGQALGKNKTVMDSTAWKRLSQLKLLYDADHARGSQSSELILLGMNYFDKFFIGYFVNFSGPNTSADNPYIVEYSFTFKVQQEVSSTNFETQQTGGTP